MSAFSSDSLASRIQDIPRVYDEAAAGRLQEALGGIWGRLPPSAQALARAVGGASPYLSRLMARDAGGVLALFERSLEATLDSVLEAADRAGDADDLAYVMRALRKAKDEAALAIGLAEIAGVWTSLEAGAALADFADAAAGAALRAALRGLGSKGLRNADRPRCEEESGISVIAMGKHGARELNYSSDIDLIVLFDPEAPALGDPLSAREIAIAAARTLVRLLNEQTADGYVFRTDLRLRPDPGVSAAAVSTRAAEAYYEAHGQNWERAAFIKARAAAGDRAVGETFLKALRPFVWRKYLDFAAIEDIHSIKRQIHAAKGGEALEFYGHDIKTGRGGIREIEFLAQTQQLILGGKNPDLRASATIDALAALNRAGQVSDEALEKLTAAYRYLRKVEHRLQMINDEQTHRIPRDPGGVERLAAFLGEESAAEFETRLTETLRNAHDLFAELFEREERLSGEGGSLIFTGVENHPATLETLEKLGFERAVDVSDTIRRWHTGAYRATRSARARELLTKLVPGLLESLGKAGDPDAAFVAFDQFLSRLPAGVQVFALFANNPHVFDILVRIMTISPYLGRELSKRLHLIEAVLESGWPGQLPDPESFLPELQNRLVKAETYEARLNEARRWASEQNFEIAAQLILDLISPEEAARLFTAAADAAIQGLLPVAREEIERSHGRIEGGLAVLGLGRLGAGAMTASSDIDLVFIYEATEGAVSTGPKQLEAADYFIRLVRRFLTALSANTEEGALYDVDMQLRPSGGKGPWAVTLASFERYYEADAWTWEESALLKARIVAGDAAVCARVRGAIDAVIARPRDSAKVARDIDDMRERLLSAKPATGPWDLKQALGGLAELDFILAFHALTAGAEVGAPPPGIRAMAGFLRDRGVIDTATADVILTASERFEAVMQVGRAATGSGFAPENAGEAMKTRMAAACGVSTIEQAEKSLAALQTAVRSLYERTILAAAGAPDLPTGWKS
ncbi:bifunctional [glutamine synthetase] adenylyltransferase/[glutamine synthetase]-adenylyl-L-tyrosine phosphorylase [Amphiplicatus metriothermophilus]|uniref:Glutamate-ammonia-ligase adenylyltransferase n=1 Tax=Amphiplicatus metriothermophilus TaxID=1519374 RepID=A0A239PT63_9PROT|nr:bifunctional [glutamine synthetase] adenylyltransferase/[glutamine synthetase]-adenylyl-L-tyrosine phosphorylase [Amphiplicatus metriothermophilus]MBB5519357.1 glutamate-ammonia-ligase adenylyltransferase [Amphiplicatus metriothermophilus]SNT73465.1 glutamate-ammonia-ligase adenylyltransferase [Amphiplicatus metriothermophilus]